MLFKPKQTNKQKNALSPKPLGSSGLLSMSLLFSLLGPTVNAMLFFTTVGVSRLVCCAFSEKTQILFGNKATVLGTTSVLKNMYGFFIFFLLLYGKLRAEPGMPWKYHYDSILIHSFSASEWKRN